MLNNGQEIKIEKIYDMTWKYFQQHAQQRIQFFNFFIVSSGALITIFITIQINTRNFLCSLLIGILQIFLVFFFMRVDKRNESLIHHGEKVACLIESNYIVNADLRIFDNEKKETKNVSGLFTSHSALLKFIYIIFFIIAISEIIIALNPIQKSQSVEYSLKSNFKNTESILKTIQESIDSLNKNMKTNEKYKDDRILNNNINIGIYLTPEPTIFIDNVNSK